MCKYRKPFDFSSDSAQFIPVTINKLLLRKEFGLPEIN